MGWRMRRDLPPWPLRVCQARGPAGGFLARVAQEFQQDVEQEPRRHRGAAAGGDQAFEPGDTCAQARGSPFWGLIPQLRTAALAVSRPEPPTAALAVAAGTLSGGMRGKRLYLLLDATKLPET
jgi:hypothetical protein